MVVTYPHTDLLKYVTKVTYELAYQEAAFHISSVVLRTLLLFITVVVLARWLCAHRRVG